MGALTIPGIGPFLAAGPILAGLSGLAIGAGAGGLVGGLIGLGIPQEEAMQYNEYLEDGHILVLVESNDTLRNNNSLNADTYEGDYVGLNRRH